MLAGHPAASESQSGVHEKSATDRESSLTGNYTGVHFTSPSPGRRERRMEALDCSCPHPPSEPASFKSGWLHSWGWQMAAEVTYLGHLPSGT